jgi:hypothetical protein
MTTAPLARPFSALISAVFAVGFLFATAIPAAACSCMAPQPMSAYAGDPSQVVFTGVVQPPDARGVPVQVTHWFQGSDPAAIVWLDRSGFGADGASCGTAMPPAGAEWIFVSWRAEGSDLGVNLCTPHAPASDPTGQLMYNDAVATFGEGITPVDPGATVPTGSGETPLLPVAAGGAVVIAGLIGLVAVVFIRRGRRVDQPVEPPD